MSKQLIKSENVENKLDIYDYQYVEMVNEKLLNYKPEYSKSDINEAICYSFGAVKVTQSEVGSDVYSTLIHEKLFEYLNNQNER